MPVLIVDKKIDEATAKQRGIWTETYIGSDNCEGGRFAAEEAR